MMPLHQDLWGNRKSMSCILKLIKEWLVLQDSIVEWEQHD